MNTLDDAKKLRANGTPVLDNDGQPIDLLDRALVDIAQLADQYGFLDIGIVFEEYCRLRAALEADPDAKASWMESAYHLMCAVNVE